ncbi:hypothetical protein STEG23_008518, partial [Scotinomys teguina]
MGWKASVSAYGKGTRGYCPRDGVWKLKNSVASKLLFPCVMVVEHTFKPSTLEAETEYLCEFQANKVYK